MPIQPGYKLSLIVATMAVALECKETRPPTATEPRAWNRVESIRDVTGDGNPDTLILEAFGKRPDSLKMVFRIRVGGHDAFRDEWNSSDRFLDYDSDISPSRATGIIRKEMNEFFDPSQFRPARELSFDPAWTGRGADCDGEPRTCISFYLRFERDSAERSRRALQAVPTEPAEYRTFIEHVDSSAYDTSLVERIGSGIQHGNALTFTYGLGYETTRTIVWSGVARRFFPVFESD